MVRDPAMLLTFVGADQVVSDQDKTPEAACVNRGRVRSLVEHWVYSEWTNGQQKIKIGHSSESWQKHRKTELKKEKFVKSLNFQVHIIYCLAFVVFL